MGTPKALLTLRGETFHHRAVKALKGAGLQVVSVVNREVNEALPPGDPGEHRLVNPDPDQPTGMFSSVRLGVGEALRLGATGVLLLPVDHPLVTSDDALAVIARLTAGAAVVVPTHQGRRGHPVGLSGALMAEILADPSATTLPGPGARGRGGRLGRRSGRHQHAGRPRTRLEPHFSVN
jgi:molybdenum cofactor cytidylyltransferase